MQPIPTADGSMTCLHPETGELYHNKAGAYTEALVNYLEPSGARALLKHTGQVRLLDVCYGLGYNTWVLINELMKDPPEQFAISVLAIESNEETLAFLPHVLKFPTFDTLKSKTPILEHNTYYRTQSDPPSFTIPVGDKGLIQINFRIEDLRKCLPEIQGDFDLVFHDPFSTQKAPELWTVDIFRHFHRLLSPQNGRLLTYSAAGAVRGGLEEAGFLIGRTAGVGVKSGGTIAITSDALTQAEGLPKEAIPLSEQERAFVDSLAGIPYRDPGLGGSAEQIRERRIEEQSASTRPSAASLRGPRRRKR